MAIVKQACILLLLCAAVVLAQPTRNKRQLAVTLPARIPPNFFNGGNFNARPANSRFDNFFNSGFGQGGGFANIMPVNSQTGVRPPRVEAQLRG